MQLTVYLAGHIHDQWRSELQQKAEAKKLPFTFVGPQDDHDRSDSIGEHILGPQPNQRKIQSQRLMHLLIVM